MNIYRIDQMNYTFESIDDILLVKVSQAFFYAYVSVLTYIFKSFNLNFKLNLTYIIMMNCSLHT